MVNLFYYLDNCVAGLKNLAFRGYEFISPAAKHLDASDQNRDTGRRIDAIVFDRCKELDLHAKGGQVPASFRFLAEGAQKQIYIGLDASSKPIDGVVYLIAKHKLLDSSVVENEAKDAAKIAQDVYLANFRALLKGIDVSSEEEAKLIEQFPTIGDLLIGLKNKNPHLEVLTKKATASGQEQLLFCLLESNLHLAVDFAPAPSVKIKGRSAMVARIAQGSLETLLRTQMFRARWEEKMDFVAQILKGFQDLHRGGYILGDPKLENMLVYKGADRPILKLTDWGRCKKLQEHERAFYEGNKRFMPPERLASYKGEVFGVGMMLVRLLEEEFLVLRKSDMLIEPSQKSGTKEKQLRSEKDPEKRRKGIERFIAIAKGAPEIDSCLKDAIPHGLRSLHAYFTQEHVDVDAEILRYLHELKKHLGDRKGGEMLIELLKDMLISDPSKRISIEEAVQRFCAYFQSI